MNRFAIRKVEWRGKLNSNQRDKEIVMNLSQARGLKYREVFVTLVLVWVFDNVLGKG